MLAPNPTNAVNEVIALVERCRADLAKAAADFEAARQQRAALEEAHVDAVIRADENVRICHRNRGAAQDRLEAALARLKREVAS